MVVRLCLALWIFALPSLLFSQDILWVKQSEDVAFNEGIWSGKMEKDSQGNVIGLYKLTGQVKLEGELLQSDGSDDILIVKYNSNGSILWKKIIGGPDWDLASDLSIDSQNNIYITASMPEGGDFLGQLLNKADGPAILAKINPDGGLLWVKQFGDTYARSNAVTVDNSNNVISAVRVTLFQLEVSKYSKDGALIWRKSIIQIDCCNQPSIIDLKVDSNNNVYVVGDFIGQISFEGQELIGTSSVFICRINVNGDYDWFNQIDSPQVGIDEVRSIEMDIDLNDDAYITGYFDQSAKFDTITLIKKNNIDDRTGYLAKIHKSGEFKWATALYGHDVIPGSIKINHQTNEVNVCLAAEQWFHYSDEYVSAVSGNQTLVLTTDLSGKFRKSFFVNNEAYPSYQSDILFGESNEFYVMTFFYQDFSLGCFNLDGGSWATTSLFKSGKLPDILIDRIDGYCLNEVIRIKAEGFGVEKATKFQWVFPEGINSVDGGFETIDNFIDIIINENFESTPFTIVPYFECYPRTEFASQLGKQITAPEKPTIPLGDTIACSGSILQYVTQPVEKATGYEWVFSSNITAQSTEGNLINVTTNVKDQIGYLMVRALNQCASSGFSDSLMVRLNPVPEKPIISGVSEVCAGQYPVSFIAFANKDVLSYGWSVSSSAKVIDASQDSAAIDLRFPIDQSEVIVAAISKGVCEFSVSDPMVVQIIPTLPELSELQGAPIICSSWTNLEYSIAPIAQSVLYHWTYPIGFVPNLNPTNSINFSLSENAQSGYIEIYISNKCFNSSSKKMIVSVSNIPPKPELELGLCERVLEYNGEENFQWYMNSQPIEFQSKIIELTDSGFYNIEVSNFCGVNVSDGIYASPVIPGNIFIPNVITPNNDNKNTYFIIDKTLKNSSLEIFDRWGKSVYKSMDYKNNWDGGELSSGVYFYILKNSCLPKHIKGSIQLLK